MQKKSYHYNVAGFGLMLHTGDNAVRVRRNLHSIGWWTWLRPKRKRAARAGTRTTRWDNSFEEIIAEGKKKING